jgi:hypothetical protein
MWGKINTALVGGLTILFALGINYIKGFNLWDIMVKAFGALGPAIMLPLLAGLFVRRINSRGAMCGIVIGMISGATLVVLNTVLLQVFKDQMAIDPSLNYWLKQGYNSVSIFANMIITSAAMWVGSMVGETAPEERKRADAFLARMDVPSDVKLSQTAGEKQSPFMAVGIALFIFGLVFLPIGFIVGGSGMIVDLIVGFTMIIIGLLLWLPNRTRAAAGTTAA